MESTKKGSAILMVLIIVTIIGILASSALKINGLIGQFALDRHSYYAKRAALEALALYGIAAGYQQLLPAKPSTKPIIKQFDHWPTAQSSAKGTVTVLFKGKEWHVKADLKEGDTTQTLTAQVSPTNDGWQIADWEYQ